MNPKPPSSISDPREAYNGWKLKNEARGGHIKGARSLPLKWTNYMDWIEIVRSKGIHPDQALVIYGYDFVESEKVAERFSRSGYENIRVYNQFLDEWCTNAALPMDHLERYHHLVYPEWLKILMDGGTPPEFEGKEYVICHGHYRNRGAYEEGHIPGAIEVDTNTLESPETWNRRSPEELKETLESLGINEDTTVILYGRFSFPDNNDPFPGSSAGHLGSIRAAFIMMYAGVKDVRILNGGLLSWEDAGYEVTTKEYKARYAAASLRHGFQAARSWPWMFRKQKKSLLQTWPTWSAFAAGPNISVKSADITTSKRRGGSRVPSLETVVQMPTIWRITETWITPPVNFMRSKKYGRKWGVVPEKHNAFYCGTGWRGSEAWFNAWLMGWPRVSVFDGGWFEWSNDPENPTENGYSGKRI